MRLHLNLSADGYLTVISVMSAFGKKRTSLLDAFFLSSVNPVFQRQARYYRYSILLSPNPLAQLTFLYRSVQHFFSSTDEH